MNEAWFPLLRCPVTGERYDLDSTRATPGEVTEGFLVARGGREVRPVLAGLAVLPRDLAAHFKSHGEVYERMPLSDSRIVRFVLGALGHARLDRVPFDEVIARYGDLVPPGTCPEPPEPAAEDAALAALLCDLDSDVGRAVDVGCGVGRGVFVLLARAERALGVDRSVARARRARNVAVTQADFFLPAPEGSDLKEVAIELSRLDRRGADFAVADPDALPLEDGCADLVVLRAGDGLGPLPDRAKALAEAVRVLATDGTLVLADGVDEPGPGWAEAAVGNGFTAWRMA